MPPGLVNALYRFKEIKQNWLGFIEDGNGEAASAGNSPGS